MAPEPVACEEIRRDAKSIDNPRLVAVLIAALKEQQQIEKLEAALQLLGEKKIGYFAPFDAPEASATGSSRRSCLLLAPGFGPLWRGESKPS
ncbi:MAG: hypothetical protein H5U38_12885 [Calditrichaeota bacterium]|nr:hypothetical protein [Calditrichota bacterium]